MAIEFSSDPVRVLAQTAYGEERSGGWNRMQGVCNVVMNRAKLPERFGEGVIGVCTKPMQFDCWNETDPNLPKIQEVTMADRLFQDAITLAKMAISGALPDITGGADSYYDEPLAAPYWTKAAGARETFVLGSTHFWQTVEIPESAKAPAATAAPVIDAPIPIPIPVSTAEEPKSDSSPTPPAGKPPASTPS